METPGRSVDVLMSPGKTPGSHEKDPKQHRLDLAAAKVIEECGGINYIQSQYMLQLSQEVVGSENPHFSNLQPHVEIPEQEAWEKALCLAVAYIKRYKMGSTLQAMKNEYENVPKSTGYARASEVENAFKSILEFVDVLKTIKPEDRIRDFGKEIEQEFPEASKIEKKD